MAVISINEIMEEGSRGATWDIDSGRKYQRKFRVITDSQFDGPVVVGTAVGAKYGDQYAVPTNELEYDPNAYCVGIDSQQDGNDGTMWIVTLTYGWYSATFAGGGKDQNPLEMPIEVSWSLRDHELVLDIDANGVPVLNTAGDPYDPPLVIDDPRLCMTVVRNEPTFNLSYVLQYRNAVNSDPFAGFNPLYCKVLNIASRSQWHQDAGWYYQTTYDFEFLSPKVGDGGNGYRPQVLSQGMRAISAVSGKIYHITLKGVPVNQPMLLDQNGYFNVTNRPKPYWQVFQAYPELPFAVFGFDPQALTGQRTGFGTL